MSKKDIVKAVVKEVAPEVIEKTTKKTVKEGAEEIIKKTAKKAIDSGEKLAKKIVPDADVALGVGEKAASQNIDKISSKLTKEEIQIAKQSAEQTTQEQAKEAGKVLMAYSTKGKKEEEAAVAKSAGIIGNAWDAYQRGDMTEAQWRKIALGEPTLEKTREVSKSYASSSGQILQDRSNSYLINFLNRNAEKIDALQNTDEQVWASIRRNLDFFDEKQMNMAKEYGIIPKETVVLSREDAAEISKANPELLHEYLSNIDNPDWQRAYRHVVNKTKETGKYNTLFKKPSHVLKNIVLLTNLDNRFWDLGSNFIAHGLSLANIAFATHIAPGARKLFAHILPMKKSYRELLLLPNSHYTGEALKNVNGMFQAVFDSIIQEYNNVKGFIKNKSISGYKETAIGRNNRKINAGYVWESKQELSRYILPEDATALKDFLEEKSKLKKLEMAASYVVSEAGYTGAKAPDVFSSGAFRGGYFAQESYAEAVKMASSQSEEIIQKHGGLNAYSEEIWTTLIAADDGRQLTKEQKAIVADFFGNGEEGQKRLARKIKYISDMAGDQAAEDVFRTGGKKTLPGSIGTILDEKLREVPVIGAIYDAFYPLVKTGIRISDTALSYNPLGAALSDAWKEIKKANSAILAGKTPNMRDVDRAIGKLTTGTMLYAGAGYLAWNKYITGRFKPSERKQLADMGIKERSIYLNKKSYSYAKWGIPGEILTVVMDIFNDIKDINDNYENPRNLYGITDSIFSMIGLFADSFGTQPIGDMLTNSIGYAKYAATPSKSGEEIFKEIMNDWSNFFKRKANTLYNFIGRPLGVEPEKYLLENVESVYDSIQKGKNGLMPRLDCFGHKVMDTNEVGDDPLAIEMWRQDAMCGEFPHRVTVQIDSEGNSVKDVPIENIERYYWRKAMSHIYDEDLGIYFDSHARMTDYILGREDYKDYTPYQELDVVARDSDNENIKLYKQKALKGMYSDMREMALKTFLSYKDKDNLSTDEEKEIAQCAKDVYNRAMGIAVEEQNVKVKSLPIRMKPNKPTLSIGE